MTLPRSDRRRLERASLTESWEDIENESDEELKASEDEQVRAVPEPPATSERISRIERVGADHAGRIYRSNKWPAGGIGLAMPASPNAGERHMRRTKTPHLRALDRSMTSDAGALDMGRSRPQIPPSRPNERGMMGGHGDLVSKSTSRRPEVNAKADLKPHSFSAGILWLRVVWPLLSYLRDIVGLAAQNAKPLLGYVLLAYVLGAVVILGSNFLHQSINNALSPICRIPGVTYLFNPPFCPRSGNAQIEGNAEFDKLVQVQSAFDEILEASLAGSMLPMAMKRSEASIRDLKHVVRYSNLPSRNELVFEFSGFIELAGGVAQDLTRFNSRVGRANDHILSITRWTLHVMEGVAKDTGSGSWKKSIAEYLNIFAPFFPLPLSENILLDQFLRHTAAVEEQILSLISEAQALLGGLENLDGRLDVIFEICTRDGVKTNDARDKIFELLWTKLGGNRESVKRYDQQLDLLKQVLTSRQIAREYVTNVIVKLEAYRAALEDLRERVAIPETVGTQKVPLEVHIASINLGIERLEQLRDTSRGVESENYARIIDRAEAHERNFISDKEL